MVLTAPKDWLGLHFSWLWSSPLGAGVWCWGPPCAGVACPGWCSWAAAQGGLLAATKSGKGPDLVFWVLWRLASACQEGIGAI